MERKLASDFFLVRYFIAFLRGDGESMSQQAAMAKASRSAEDLMSHLEALRLAGSARLQDARRTAAIAVAIAKQSGTISWTLWKNADPDIQVLKEAQAEYARLP